MTRHVCLVKFETRKIDECSGTGINKCSGDGPMILDVWYEGKDGTECFYDEETSIMVNFCPFCGNQSSVKVPFIRQHN